MKVLEDLVELGTYLDCQTAGNIQDMRRLTFISAYVISSGYTASIVGAKLLAGTAASRYSRLSGMIGRLHLSLLFIA